MYVMNLTNMMAAADIVRAAETNATVARLIDDHVFIGTARSIGDAQGYFAGVNDEIWTTFLRVTLDSGFEAFWPMAELISERRSGMFVPDYAL